MIIYDASNVLVPFFNKYKESKAFTIRKSSEINTRTSLKNVIVVASDIVRDGKPQEIEISIFLEDSLKRKNEVIEEMQKLMQDQFLNENRNIVEYDGNKYFVDFILGQINFVGINDNIAEYYATSRIVITKKKEKVNRQWRR